MEMAVSLSLVVVAIYAVVGVAFALVFHLALIKSFDPGTQGSGMAFRLMITPGIVALWPILALRVVRMGPPPAAEAFLGPRKLRHLHRGMTLLLIACLPVAGFLALAFRPSPPPTQDLAKSGLGEAPLPSIHKELPKLFPILGLSGRVRTDGTRWQLELDVDRDLQIAMAALFFAPAGASEQPEPLVFLGTVWGPGTLIYDLPESVRGRQGNLLVHSLASGEPVDSVALPEALF